jgi:hypothetical protein
MWRTSVKGCDGYALMDDACSTMHQLPGQPGLGAPHVRLPRSEEDGHTGERCGGAGAGHEPRLGLVAAARLDGHDAHGQRLVLAEHGCR